MRLRILPATVDHTPGQALSGYLVDDVIAIDAGPLGASGSMEEQAKVQHIFLTHSHIDHIAGLPMFLDNNYGATTDCPTVYGLAGTLESLQIDIFNGRVMPDFIGMSARMAPFLKLVELTPGNTLVVGPYSITPIPVDHGVPTVGFVVGNGEDAFALFTDTRPIPGVLRTVASIPSLRAIFLECSFPKRLQSLAVASYHHSTDDFLAAARSLPNLPFYPIHIKPQFWDEILGELRDAGLPNVRTVRPGDCIEIR
jgi:ribonuclease BN (tRNA processing enzyme)